MKLWMRFTNLGNLLCMTAAHVKILISLVNQTTFISGAIPWGCKRVSTYYCPFNITCDCDAGIRVSEFKTKLLLEATGAHDMQSHRFRVMHAGCSARGVGGFNSDLSDNSSDSVDSADDSCGLACYSRMCTVHSRSSAQAINSVLRACCTPVGKRRLWLSILCGHPFRRAQF